jgi:Arc/MetJ-type ribon-helix-helix transcriptional regulator
LEKLLQDGKFRNKSHIIEYSLDKFLKEILGE